MCSEICICRACLLFITTCWIDLTNNFLFRRRFSLTNSKKKYQSPLSSTSSSWSRRSHFRLMYDQLEAADLQLMTKDYVLETLITALRCQITSKAEIVTTVKIGQIFHGRKNTNGLKKMQKSKIR